MDIKIELEHLEKQIALMNKATQAMSPENIGHRELTSVIGPLLALNLSTAQSIKCSQKTIILEISQGFECERV